MRAAGAIARSRASWRRCSTTETCCAGAPTSSPPTSPCDCASCSARARDDRAERAAVDRTLRRARDIAKRVGVRFDSVDIDSIDVEHAGAVLLLAYPDRLAVRRSQPGQFQLRTGTGAWVAKDDPLAFEAFVVAADVDGQRKSTRIRLAAGIDADEIEAALGDEVETRRSIAWDRDRNDIVERTVRRLGGMQLDERVRRPEPADTTTEAIVERFRATRLGALRWTDAASRLRDRVEFLRQRAAADTSRTDRPPWPDWSDAGLIATIDEWLAPYLRGMTSLAEVAALDLVPVLRAGLPWPLGADLDAAAPAHLDLPSGRSVAIDYSGGTPAASVRVQDLFGVRVHPLAAGVPVVLHLLSPADRPIQTTADLPGFWAGTWAEVRKEMAGRYPKHQWPADPAAAAPKRLKDR